MAVIYLRHVLQRPLTFGELDANFENLNLALQNLGLNDLNDVIITTGTTGMTSGTILVYNSASSQWENQELTQNITPTYFVSYDPVTGQYTYSNLVQVQVDQLVHLVYLQCQVLQVHQVSLVLLVRVGQLEHRVKAEPQGKAVHLASLVHQEKAEPQGKVGLQVNREHRVSLELQGHQVNLVLQENQVQVEQMVLTV